MELRELHFVQSCSATNEQIVAYMETTNVCKLSINDDIVVTFVKDSASKVTELEPV